MRLRFTENAIADIENIYDHIALDRPKAAARVASRIRSAAAQLAEFPFIGRDGVEPRTREWVIPGLPYIVVYRVSEPSDLLVINVFHGAREPRHPSGT